MIRLRGLIKEASLPADVKAIDTQLIGLKKAGKIELKRETNPNGSIYWKFTQPPTRR